MANSIAKFKNYTDQLDEVYKLSSLTAELDGDNTLVQMGVNANEIVIPKMSMDGLGDYSRATGYNAGDVTIEMETKAFNYDRGRKFGVDAMDDEETAGVAFGKLASEFIRVKVAPEVDAVRFAKYASKAGSSTTGTLNSATGVVQALRTGINAMDEAEVPEEDRILFITPTLLGLLEDQDTTASRKALDSFMNIVKVPQNRFYTKITLLDGDPTSTSKKAGGYAKDATEGSEGKDINFMIISKSAVLQYEKHIVNKVISPEENQNSDQWLFFFREYGLNEVYENKTKGIYLHSKA